MIELISGKEAFDYAYEGLEVLYRSVGFTGWASFNDAEWSIDDLKSNKFEFILEPRTITLNGIEVPAPFEPKKGEDCWFLSDNSDSGYSYTTHKDSFSYIFDAVWKSEYEIKQVVAALRSVFNVK